MQERTNFWNVNLYCQNIFEVIDSSIDLNKFVFKIASTIASGLTSVWSGNFSNLTRATFLFLGATFVKTSFDETSLIISSSSTQLGSSSYPPSS